MRKSDIGLGTITMEKPILELVKTTQDARSELELLNFLMGVGSVLQIVESTSEHAPSLARARADRRTHNTQHG